MIYGFGQHTHRREIVDMWNPSTENLSSPPPPSVHQISFVYLKTTEDLAVKNQMPLEWSYNIIYHFLCLLKKSCIFEQHICSENSAIHGARAPQAAASAWPAPLPWLTSHSSILGPILTLNSHWLFHSRSHQCGQRQQQEAHYIAQASLDRSQPPRTGTNLPA